MPRPITAVRVPVDLAREIDRLLHCSEMLPLVGRDAARARKALNDLSPLIFSEPLDTGAPCVVCKKPIPMERAFNAVMRGQRALYDTDTCRETARKRRYRES